jgi:hypothetical protein
LPFDAVSKARPVPKNNAAPPSNAALNLSGLSDFLVMDTFLRVTRHSATADLTKPLLEHYKVESEWLKGFL